MSAPPEQQLPKRTFYAKPDTDDIPVDWGAVLSPRDASERGLGSAVPRPVNPRVASKETPEQKHRHEPAFIRNRLPPLPKPDESLAKLPTAARVVMPSPSPVRQRQKVDAFRLDGDAPQVGGAGSATEKAGGRPGSAAYYSSLLRRFDAQVRSTPYFKGRPLEVQKSALVRAADASALPAVPGA